MQKRKAQSQDEKVFDESHLEKRQERRSDKEHVAACTMTSVNRLVSLKERLVMVTANSYMAIL